MRRRVAEISLLGASLAVALIAADLAAAWVLSRPPKRYPVALFPEDRVRNSAGFRDYEYPEEKAPGVFRVLGVGDSFTYGGGIDFDDAWPKRLERYLAQYRAAPGRRFQVLNLGAPGTGTAQQVAQLKGYAERWRPDLIVLAYCLNDAEDPADRKGLEKLRERTWHYKLEPRGRFDGWILEHWKLYRLARLRLLNMAVNRGHLDYYHALYREDYPGWAKAQQAVADLGAFSRESGIPVVALVFPLLSWDMGDDYPFRVEHARIDKTFKKAGIPCLDLRPAYQGLDHVTLEAVPFTDPHPSDVAQRIAAERLFKFLDKQRLIPKDQREAGAHRQVPPPGRHGTNPLSPPFRKGDAGVGRQGPAVPVAKKSGRSQEPDAVTRQALSIRTLCRKMSS